MATGSSNVEMGNALTGPLCAMVHLTVVMVATKPGLTVKVSLHFSIHIMLI